jgi:hypothetical protein
MEPVRRKIFRTNVRKPRVVVRPVSMKECVLPNEGPDLQRNIEDNKERELKARSE